MDFLGFGEVCAVVPPAADRFSIDRSGDGFIAWCHDHRRFRRLDGCDVKWLLAYPEMLDAF